MIKITNEIDGKLYELTPEKDVKEWSKPCEGCAFDMDRGNVVCTLKPKDDSFNGCCVCSELRGIWKEVKDEKTN